MRELETHRTGSDLNEKLHVYVLDEPDEEKGGGACHTYQVCYVQVIAPQPDPRHNTAMMSDERPFLRFCMPANINFQHGAVKEHGLNGCSDESLMAILVDRLQHFQAGPFACDDNQVALDHLLVSLQALQARTADRVERGVEGKSMA